MTHWFTYPTNVDPVALHLGFVKIHWYGIAYLAGFAAVFLWMSRPEGRRRLGLTRDQIGDFLFYALIGVLVGGRTFFVFNDIISKHDLPFYLSNPLNFIAVWNGGMAFHGGLVGVMVAVALFIARHRPVTFSVLADELVVLLPVGIVLTRLVNFINDELWGDPCAPDRPWCMVPNRLGDSMTWGTDPRHPAQLYEAILDALTLPIVYAIYKRRLPDGVTAWAWFTIYGITRSIAEIWRHADFMLGPFTGGQLYAMPMIVVGIVMMALCWRRGVRTDATIPAVTAANVQGA